MEERLVDRFAKRVSRKIHAQVGEGEDWAQELIEDLKKSHIAGIDDATTFFAEAYADGDSVEAWTNYQSKAVKEIGYKGGDSLLIFPDRSCYAEWEQGINRFYPDVADIDIEGVEDFKEFERDY